MNSNKAVGQDGIVIEMLSDLDDFGIDIITEIIYEIYKSTKISEDLRSNFEALYKKPGSKWMLAPLNNQFIEPHEQANLISDELSVKQN